MLPNVLISHPSLPVKTVKELIDLALAARYYELLGSRVGLPAAPDLASLRQPVSAAAPARS